MSNQKNMNGGTVINEEEKLHEFVCQTCGGNQLTFHKFVRSRESLIFTEDGRIEYGPPCVDETHSLGVELGYICRECKLFIKHGGQNLETEDDLRIYLSKTPDEIAADNEEYEELMSIHDNDDENDAFYPGEEYAADYEHAETFVPLKKHEPITNNFACSQCCNSSIAHEKWLQCREEVDIDSEGHIAYGPPQIDEDKDIWALSQYVCGNCGASVAIGNITMKTEDDLISYLSFSPEERAEQEKPYVDMVMAYAEAERTKEEEETHYAE